MKKVSVLTFNNKDSHTNIFTNNCTYTKTNLINLAARKK